MIIEFSLTIEGRINQDWTIEVPDGLSDEQILVNIQEEMQEALADE